MKLWEPTGCCFCFSLRTGSLILCSFILIGCALNLYISWNSLNNNDKLVEVIDEYCSREVPDDSDCKMRMKKLVTGLLTTQMIMSVIKMICSSLMILGITKNMTNLMIPMMILLLIQLVFALVTGLSFIIMLATFVSGAAAFGALLFIVVVLYFETYFLLVLRAYYMQVKRAAGLMHDVLQEAEATVGIPENKVLLKLKN